jgi:hypothetical protein
VPEPDLDDVADRLYALPPEEFTAARDDAARKADDTQQRTAVKALRRPSASAWVVNLLARGQAELLEQLLDLGPVLAQAQRTGQGETLRALGQQRRELVVAVTSAAVDLAGRSITAQVRSEVEQTLEAALADPASAEAVRSGRLVRALSYAGFGEVDLGGAVAVQPARSAPLPERAKDDDARAGAERAALDAAAALDDAVRACEKAVRHRDDAAEAQAAADRDAATATDTVRELDAALTAARRHQLAAEKIATSAQGDAVEADRSAERARDAVAAAQRNAEKARASLDRMRRA